MRITEGLMQTIDVIALVAQLIDAILGSNVNPILYIECELISNINPT